MEEPSRTRQAIGHRIKEAIERRHISQNALARHFGKVPSATNGWTTGRTQPSLEELAEICRLTGVSADWIVGAPHAPAPPPASFDRKLIESAADLLARAALALRKADGEGRKEPR